MVSTNSTPLRVSLLGVSSHNRAILEFFFAGAGKHLFKLVPEAEAEVIIADFDHPNTEQEWQQHAAEQQRPCVILSMREVQIPQTVWVAKPLSIQALTQAASQVRALLPETMASNPVVDTSSSSKTEVDFTTTLPATPQPFGLMHQKRRLQKPALVVPVTEATQEPRISPAKTDKPTENEAKQPRPQPPRPKTITPLSPQTTAEQVQRWQLLCGEREDTHLKDLATQTDWFYTPETYLISKIRDAVRLANQSAQPVHLEIGLRYNILLLPHSHQVFGDINWYSGKFAQLCSTPIQPGQVQLHIPSTTDLAELENRLQKYSSSVERLIWTSSLLTARGRLSRSSDIGQTLILTHWPNLTRVESIPHVMRIAASWHQQPGTLFEVAQRLDIPQRYVAAFHTAASALGLLVEHQGTIPIKEKTEPQQNRGLFARLLKRLLGGGSR